MITIRRPSWVRLVVPVVGLAVLAVGCGGGGDDDAGAFREPAGPPDTTVTIDSGNLYFDPETPSTTAGVVAVELRNEAGIHTLVFERVPGYQLEVNGSGRDTLRVRLRRGRYTFYCDVPGHRSAGMSGVLTVR